MTNSETERFIENERAFKDLVAFLQAVSEDYYLCRENADEDFVPISERDEPLEGIVATYLGIDLDKIAEEKEQLWEMYLQELREAHQQEELESDFDVAEIERRSVVGTAGAGFMADVNKAIAEIDGQRVGVFTDRTVKAFLHTRHHYNNVLLASFSADIAEAVRAYSLSKSTSLAAPPERFSREAFLTDVTSTIRWLDEHAKTVTMAHIDQYLCEGCGYTQAEVEEHMNDIATALRIYLEAKRIATSATNDTQAQKPRQISEFY